MKVTRLGNTRPLLTIGSVISSGSAPSGHVPTASGSNGVAWGSNVAIISAGGSNVLGPFVNFAAGSNITLTIDQVGAVASNTIRIHASGASSFGSNSNAVSQANAPGAATDSSRADHVHMGVTSLAHSSNTFAGPVVLTASGSLGITSPTPGTYNLSATGGSGGSGSVATDVIWDAKGDLAGGTGANTAVRLAVGSNGTVLTADSAQATGLKWAAPLGVWYATAYGATGNGTTNDAAAIQAAMDACGAAGGGIVFLAPGDFELGTTTLQFKYSNIRVIGSGKHISATAIATRLTYTGGGAMFENSDTATPTVRNYCGVQSMTLDFSGATTGASALKINAFRSGMWSELYIVSNSTGAGGTWRGIWMTGGTNNQTYFNRFTDVDIALTGAAGTQWCVDMDGFWVNRNTFFGGIWEGNNANALGIRPASSFSDTNHFEAVQFQTHGATIVQLGGSGGQANDNSFVACRFESTVATVITFATASGIPQRNTFINSYRSNVNFSDPDMGAGNQIVDSYGWLLDTLKPGDAPNSILLRGYQSGMTIGRSDGASGVLSLGESNYGTAPAANFAQILSQDIGGVTKLRARFSDGSEWDIGPLHKVFRLAADHAISATTATEVTGLGPCTLVPGTYVFDFEIIEQSATATVSPLYGVNFTGTAAVKTIWFDYADASADLLAATNTADDEGTTALGFAMRQATRAYSTTAPNLGHAGGVATINVDIMVRVHGIVIVTASGDLELWHGSETATSTTVKAGSALIVTRVA